MKDEAMTKITPKIFRQQEDKGKVKCYLFKAVEGGVGGIVCDEKPHVLIAHLHRSRSVHPRHAASPSELYSTAEEEFGLSGVCIRI